MAGAAQGAEQVCVWHSQCVWLCSALQAHHCQWHYCDMKSYALHSWKEGILSQFKSKAREHSSNTPKPLPLQHLQTADPAWPRDRQSHCTWSTTRQRNPTAVTGSTAGPSARATAGTWLSVYSLLHFAVQPTICLVIRKTTLFFQLQ